MPKPDGDAIPDAAQGGLRWPAIIVLVMASLGLGLGAGLLRADWREAVLEKVASEYQSIAVSNARNDLLDERLVGMKEDIADLKADSREQREAMQRLEDMIRELAAKIP